MPSDRVAYGGRRKSHRLPKYTSSGSLLDWAATETPAQSPGGSGDLPKEGQILHWVVLTVTCPQLSGMNRSGGGDERIPQI